jgi:hypothetical protein
MTLVVAAAGTLTAVRNLGGPSVVLQGVSDDTDSTITIEAFNSDGSSAVFDYEINQITPTEMTLMSTNVIWDFGSGSVAAGAIGAFLKSP